MDNKKNNYINEIDGLRAIAVISVIFYHSEFILFEQKFFKGGFLGVDIFFIISGYLITSIIINNYKNSNFSLKVFYFNRIKRIFPALIFILSVNLILGFFILLPDEIVNLARSYISSIFFISNYFFYFSGQEYSAVNSLQVPFLHTWSLGVEEQFYIIFPIIFLLSYKLLRFKKIIILIFLLSFIFANYFANLNPSLNFYLFFSRIWEMMLGGMLNFYNLENLKKKNKLCSFLSFSGLFLILFCFLFANNKITHPSIYTLIPLAGTILIIITADNSEIKLNNFLTTNFMVFIGKISFSLYLWHYPIFAFARILEIFNKSLIFNTLIYISIFFLSVLTYFFIEQPFRRKLNFKTTIIFLSVMSIFFISFSNYLITKKGLPERFPEMILDHFNNSHPYHLVKNKKNEFCHNQTCTFNTEFDYEIFLLGDSNAATLQKPLLDLANEYNFKFTTMTNDGCSYVKNFEKISKKTNKVTNCNQKMFDFKRNKILNNNQSLVIIGQRMPLYLSGYYFDNKEGGIEGGEWTSYWKNISTDQKDNKNIIEEFKKNYIESINEILDNGNKVVLIYPIPEVGWSPIRKLLNDGYYQKSNILSILKNNDISTSYSVFLERAEETFKLYDQIHNQNVYRVYPHKLFCDIILKNRCVVNNYDDIYYYDDDHLSLKGSKLLVNQIRDIIISLKKS